MALFKRGNVWWYEFYFAGRRIRESAKTTSKTVAKLAEKQRRRDLEKGFNGIEDSRDDRIRSVEQLAAEYLEEYRLRHKAATFAEYAIENLNRHLGETMAVDVTDKIVKAYQTARLKEKAAPKTVNEEVGFLLRILGEAGDAIRARLRRQKSLKLAVRHRVGKAYTPEEKMALLGAAKSARSAAIYPALVLALNAGMRDAEIRGLQWERMNLSNAVLTVGDSKTEAGEGRTIPLNSALLESLYGKGNVLLEENGVDITVKGPTTILVELKTTSNGRQAIRDAVGQLLEYAYYQSPMRKEPLELVIMAPGRYDRQAKDYIERLRAKFHLPIQYCSYSIGDQLPDLFGQAKGPRLQTHLVHG